MLTLWSLHWLLREKHVISLPLQTIPFLEYEYLCKDVRKAFPGLPSLVNSIESALATTIAEDLRKMTMMATCLILTATPTVSTFQLWMNTLCLRSQFSSTTLHLKSCFSFMISRPFQLLASPFMTYSVAYVVTPG